MATRYTDEFRRDAVRIAITSGLTKPKAASDLGVRLSTLNKWIHKHLNEDDQNAYLETVKTVIEKGGSWIENYWFKIDDYTHGSVSIYTSKEAWEN